MKQILYGNFNSHIVTYSKPWKYILSVILTFFIILFSHRVQAQLSSTSLPFSFTPIPLSNPDLNAPGRGVEQWNNDNEVRVPVEDSVTQRLDVYYRFTWNRLETSQNNYTWTFFDNLIKTAIDNNQKLSFGIISCYPDVIDHQAGITQFGGGYSAYPLYLHNLMKAEPVKDWLAGNTWVPNYNSEKYLSRLLALHTAVNSHIENASYKGVKFKDVIGYIDVRGYGSWGEWHHHSIVDSMTKVPAGARATTATLKRIIDIHTQGFPNFPLVAMISAFDADRLPNTMNPPEITDYILKSRNNWGLLGWRRDNWGATDAYFSDYLENNNKSIHPDSTKFNIPIMKRWQYAPIVGEPSRNLNNMITEYSNLESQMRLYHATSFGNGNYGIPISPAIKDYVRAASKAAGYRLILESGNISSSFVSGTSFSVTLQWNNTGISPIYEKWNVIFQLVNNMNLKVWEGLSQFTPKSLLPGTPTTVTDNFSFPTNLPAGNYKLNIIIKDPSNYRLPLPLAINGRNADGSYSLQNNIAVTLVTSALSGSVILQGRPPAPDPSWITPLKIDLYANGNTTTPDFTFHVTTDNTGRFTVAGIPLGTYKVAVKTTSSLQKVNHAQPIVLGENNINVDILLEGDANNDNKVNIFDFGFLAGSFNKNQNDPGYDIRADFNKDGTINIFDFGLLAGNFLKISETP